jgi:hypothetical protein
MADEPVINLEARFHVIPQTSDPIRRLEIIRRAE